MNDSKVSLSKPTKETIVRLAENYSEISGFYWLIEKAIRSGRSRVMAAMALEEVCLFIQTLLFCFYGDGAT